MRIDHENRLSSLAFKFGVRYRTFEINKSTAYEAGQGC